MDSQYKDKSFLSHARKQLGTDKKAKLLRIEFSIFYENKTVDFHTGALLYIFINIPGIFNV